MTDPKEAYRDFKEEKDFRDTVRKQEALQASEPPVVKHVRETLRESFVCGFCGATGRGDVSYRADLSEDGETVVEIECRAFVDGKKCGNVQTRYY